MATPSQKRQLDAAKSLIAEAAGTLDLNASVRLWDGSVTPLGKSVTGPLEISIANAGVIGGLLRWPTLDNVIRRYIEKDIDFSGGTLIDFGQQLNRPGRGLRSKDIKPLQLAGKLRPFLFATTLHAKDEQGFEGDARGRKASTRNNEAYIRFHYDVSNEFYALFLDPEMVYSCAYFTDWENSIAQAQRDKLELICRKLRLKPGERFLDIGCGWGGLVCYAALKYGVTAHGITLSEEQLEFARDKAKRAGLADKVTFEFIDYAKVSGTFDKIASIGMYEHIGLKNIEPYMKKMRSLLSPDGVFLNHAISRRAPKPSLLGHRIRPEQKALAKYIFPGGELDDIGHTVTAMERAGFEVHDVEALREHYAQTCKIWCERLSAEMAKAIELVGEEKYRIWVAYLAGCSLAFERGSARIFQTVATKSAKGKSPLPQTRADLYRT
jgi:cyclopropane-fatty-acyl-phospholipid synthase